MSDSPNTPLHASGCLGLRSVLPACGAGKADRSVEMDFEANEYEYDGRCEVQNIGTTAVRSTVGGVCVYVCDTLRNRHVATVSAVAEMEGHDV